MRPVMEREQHVAGLDVAVKGLHAVGIVESASQDHPDPGDALRVGPASGKPSSHRRLGRSRGGAVALDPAVSEGIRPVLPCDQRVPEHAARAQAGPPGGPA